MEDKNLTEREIAGLSIFIVEDESMIAMMLEDILDELGCKVVGVASRLKEAAEKLSSLSFDAVVLDVNLNGHPTYPLGEMLQQKGKPFVFATGYGDATLPQTLHGVPIVSKPFDQHDLERALRAVL